MSLRNKNRAQSTAELAMVIACVVAALLAMAGYLKRGISGRIRAVADEIGEQYSPGDVVSEKAVDQGTDTESVVYISSKAPKKDEGNNTIGEILQVERQERTNWDGTTRSGNETVGELEEWNWDF